MAISQFSNPNYQTVYDAGMARLAEIERQKRAMATNAAGTAGVRESGVSQIPQDEISRGAVLAESQLGSDVAQQQEQERLQQEQFAQQEKMVQEQADLQARNRDNELNYLKRQGKAQFGGQVVGGVLSAGLSALASRYLNPTGIK